MTYIAWVLDPTVDALIVVIASLASAAQWWHERPRRPRT